MANLLSAYAGRVNAIAGHSRYIKPDPDFRSPCETRYLGLPRRVPRLYEALNWTVPFIVWRGLANSIAKMFKKSGTDIVLAAYPRDDFLVAGKLAVDQRRDKREVRRHDLDESPRAPHRHRLSAGPRQQAAEQPCAGERKDQ